MFLNEFDCDNAKYVNKAKKIVEDYFASFFDVKFAPVIRERLNQTSLIFVKRNQTHIDSCFNYIDFEKKLLTIEWFKKLNLPFANKVDYLDDFVKNNIILIRNYLKPSKKNVEIIKEKLDLIGKNNFEVNKDFVKGLIKNYKENLYNDLKKLDDLKLKILLDKPANNDFIGANVLLDDIGEDLANKINIFSQNGSILNLLRKFTTDNNTDGMFVNGDFNHLKINFCLFDSPEQLTALTFVHELLHAISYDYFSINNVYKYGLEYAKNLNYDGEYKYLNEILTEYFSFKITNNLIKDNKAPFFRDTNSTSYSKCFVLVEPFFKKYEEKLKHFYLYYSPENLNKYFGKDNLKKIDDLLLKFSSIYKNVGSQYKIYNYDKCLKLASARPNNLSLIDKKYLECFKQMEQIVNDIDTNVKNLGRETICTF